MEDTEAEIQGDIKERTQSKCNRFRAWFGGAHFCLYVTYVMGSWGDRMWMFAAGLYLVSLSNGVLRLAAILGFTGGGCILLLGGVIGNWVDENPRLKVVRITLFVQNLSVAMCSVCVCITLYYTDEPLMQIGTPLRYLMETLIIALAIIASLSSVAYKIAIEKDWIIIVAGQDSDELANLNARMRAIDLLCSLLAPMSVGFIMSYTSLVVSAIVIAVWNVFSVFVEYNLLYRVYVLVPRLAIKEDEKKEQQDIEMTTNPSRTSRKHDSTDNELHNEPELRAFTPLVEDKNAEEAAEANNQKQTDETSSLTIQPVNQASMVDIPLHDDDSKTEVVAKKTSAHRLFRPFVTFVRGWKTYHRQKVLFAGLALSFLYMTVLGLDSVTTGYIFATGVAEVWVGLAMGLSGLSGVFGTFVFTWLHKRNGLERTGLVAFNLEILCLGFCVASVFAPGSPFEPLYKLPKPGEAPPALFDNCTDLNSNELLFDKSIQDQSVNDNRTRRSVQLEELNLLIESQNRIGEMYIGSNDQPQLRFIRFDNQQQYTFGNMINDQQRRFVRQIDNQTLVISDNGTIIDDTNTSNSTDSSRCKPPLEQGWNIAMFLLIFGLITSRTGLWMADLTITQLLQENVAEKERGIVNGVQNSLNMFMEMLKFALVIVIPYVETYGYLVLLSFTFICTGGILFAYYSWSVRGHLFHFEKICGTTKAKPRMLGAHPRDPSIELCSVPQSLPREKSQDRS